MARPDLNETLREIIDAVDLLEQLPPLNNPEWRALRLHSARVREFTDRLLEDIDVEDEADGAA